MSENSESENFDGPYPERVYIPEEFINARNLDPQINDGVDKFYDYVDMVYNMFFDEEINPYSRQPYVINPRLSPNNLDSLDNILTDGAYECGIQYDLPTDDPDKYETVELVINFTFYA
jgi:hypothetical protein